ncbi:hypothetical protein [Paraburkholderia strydomiana]|uniref:CHAT domain-containing protein n=1 Tax=Paraburkholderia strydomiana TaxID=1245417 RepID=A0ABW9BWV1_9BURK
MAELQLQICAQGAGQIKLSWMGAIWRSYCVDKACLESAGADVRSVLQSIADEYTDPNPSYEDYLPTLARAGERLKSALFASPDSAESADEVGSFLTGLGQKTSLCICSDSSVHLPWNFVYAGNPNAMPKPTGKLSDFDDFWTNRFKIRIRFQQASVPPKTPISKKRVKTLLALHNERFKAATQALKNDPELQRKIRRLLEHEIGHTNNWFDCRSKWDNLANEDSIFYIFAHSDGKSLSLSDKPPCSKSSGIDRYLLSPSGFQTYFRKSRSNPTNTLCFINGCRTADGDWGNGFLSTTSTHGFQGFIGSEAEVPNDRATKYAVEFLSHLLEGSTVDVAFEATRELCFPMSLWYSCYAYPDFQISAR